VNHFKTIFFYCSLIFSVSSCRESPKVPSTPDEKFTPKGDLSDLVYNPMKADGTLDSTFLPILTLEEKEFDFGTIHEGDIVKKDFKFKNTGTAPLLIINGTSTCGCTVPEWPKRPIPPDSTGIISVKFDSKNKEGHQTKEVTIFANTFPNRTIIIIKGKVEKTK
jgi:hypothetical protein